MGSVAAGTNDAALGHWLPLVIVLAVCLLGGALYAFAPDLPKSERVALQARVARDEANLKRAREAVRKAEAALVSAQEQLQRDRAALAVAPPAFR